MRENKSFCTQGNCAFQADRMRNCHRRRCLCFGGFDARSAIADSGCPSCDIWGGLLYRMPCSCIHLYQEKSKVKTAPVRIWPCAWSCVCRGARCFVCGGNAFAGIVEPAGAVGLLVQSTLSGRRRTRTPKEAIFACGFGITKRTVHMRTVRFARNDGETEVYRKG